MTSSPPKGAAFAASPTRALAAAACLAALFAFSEAPRGALADASSASAPRCLASPAAGGGASAPAPASAGAPPRRIALIMHFQMMGPALPPALNYVAEACGWQRNAADCLFFLVVSDADADAARRRPAAALFACRDERDALPPNVLVRVLSHAEWAALLLRAAHVVAQPLGNHRKQADYKPLYGDLFSEHLREDTYSHFGWIDPDTIIGNLTRFDIFAFDVYTSVWPPAPEAFTPFIAGQLAIFRNTAALRHLYLAMPDLVARMNDAAQLGLDESELGAVVFPAAQRFGYRADLRYESFQDYPNESGYDHDDFFFERGRVLAVRKCSAGAPEREAVLIHIAGIKRSPSSESCDFINEPRGWALPRWNLAATKSDNRLVPSFASFHDPLFGTRC